MKSRLLLGLIALTASCYQPQRDCKAFQEGSFRFSATINGEEQTTEFTRKGDLEISIFQGKTDSASVRWLNDCEYILTNLNDSTPGADKPIHMKILSTGEDSYTFEYKLVGTSQTSRGTAYKIN